jgi:Ca-activated chloride channel homolog
MYLQNPQLLLLLWLLPIVGGLFVYAQRRRAAAAHRFAGDVMLRRLMPVMAKGRVWMKTVVLLAGLGLLIFAAARPRWGVYFEDVHSRGVDMVVLLDVSRSMLAEDVAPNRLERAKSDIRDLLQHLEGDRVGLIAFAGAAVVQAPLTTDHGFFQMILDDTDPDSAPRGGSLIGDAIRKALEAMPPRHDRDQVIVLITDGEDHDSFPAEAAKAAAERNVKVIAVGLGDADQGMRIPMRDATGNLSYLKHDGQEVWSKMDEALLKEIALTTGGAYIPARTRAYDLGQVYADHLLGLTRGEVNAEKKKRYRERFQLFVVLGLSMLLLEMVVPRYPRRREDEDA